MCTISFVCHRKGEDLREKKVGVKLGVDEVRVKQGVFQSVHQSVMSVPQRLFHKPAYML